MIEIKCHRSLIYKALVDSCISHDELVLVNDVLKEYNEMKEATKNLETWWSSENFNLHLKQCYHIV